MGQRKTRPVTDMGRLVTRAQLQNAANQIVDAVSNGLRQLEEQQDARFARIEAALNLPPMDARPELVEDEPKVPA
jgi:hypothetical protein